MQWDIVSGKSSTRKAREFALLGALRAGLRTNECESPASVYEAFVKSGGPRSTSCAAGGKWLEAFAAADPRPDKVVMTIGCNNAVDFLYAYSLWDHSPEPLDIHRYISGLCKMGSCPHPTTTFCLPDAIRHNSTSDMQPPSASKGGFSKHTEGAGYSSPLGICVEASPDISTFVKEVLGDLGYNGPHGGWPQSVNVVNAAGSNTADPPFIDFPVGRGKTIGVLGVYYNDDLFKQPLRGFGHYVLGNEPTQPVKLLTGDLILRDYPDTAGRDLIIFIDTEGNDVLVLYGLAQTLATGRVRYIEFEGHSIGDWGTRKLSEAIVYLDSFHFDCFWPQDPDQGKIDKDLPLSRITGCWDDRYDSLDKTWSNVVCVNRKDKVWEPIMRSFSKS